MVNSPLVSIVIPVYNREKLIHRSLQSALAQDYPEVEILVTDNCSTDSTWEVLEEYAINNEKIRIIKNEANLGPVKNWYRAVELAKGEYVKILWSDDTIEAGFISQTLNYLHDDVAFVLGGVEIKTLDGELKEKYGGDGEIEILSQQEYYQRVFLGPTDGIGVSPGQALFRKKDLLRSFVFDIPNADDLDFNRYGAGTDLLLFLNTAKAYPRIIFNRQILCSFLYHENSITIRSRGRLNLYYDYAKYYFLDSNRMAQKAEFVRKVFQRNYYADSYTGFFQFTDWKEHLKILIHKFLLRNTPPLIKRSAKKLISFWP